MAHARDVRNLLFGFFLPIGLCVSLFLLSLPGCVQVCAAQEPERVTIHRDADFRTTTYRIVAQGCTLEWIARDSEPGMVKHHAPCSWPLAAQLPLIRKIYDSFLHNEPAAGQFRTLFWGRIEPDTSGGSREMAQRLALAAYQSPEWDARRGKHKKGDINGFAKTLANRAGIYPELKALFAEFDRELHICSVEKVLVTKAVDLPFYEALKAHGVQPEDKLPFDCLTWFCLVTQ